MPFRPVKAEKLSLAVVRQIEDLILRGILRPGERLPSERDLAERFDVSRPSLRDALGHLQDNGLVSSKAGAGIYVGDVLGSAFSPALQDLMSRHETAVDDYLAFRRDMEGLAAARAAQTGSATDLAVVNSVYEQMVSAHQKRDKDREAALDAQFHMAIVEASHNVIMLHMMRSMYELLQSGVFYNRQVMFGQSTTRDILLEQHRDINIALQAKDPQQARNAVETHLDYVRKCLRDSRRAEANENIARLRLDHQG
ncbi:MAG: FadR/GntR family transcriptional regulator [Paracoccaceae bacterium]